MDCNKDQLLDLVANYLTKQAEEISFHYDLALKGIDSGNTYQSPMRVMCEMFKLLRLPTKNEIQMEKFIETAEEFNLIVVKQMNPEYAESTYDLCEEMAFKLMEQKEMLEV